jgi:hypothetical protein
LFNQEAPKGKWYCPAVAIPGRSKAQIGQVVNTTFRQVGPEIELRSIKMRGISQLNGAI